MRRLALAVSLVSMSLAASVTVGSAQAPAAAPAPPAQGPPGGENNPYRQAARLPVRITSFTVEPRSIQPGQSVTLVWATENPTSITIDPIGKVAPRGRQQLTPASTITYTLKVTGAGNSSDMRSVTVNVAGTTAATAAPADAAPAAKKPAPRTADGKPDLTGVYGYGAFGGGRGAPPATAAPGSLPTTPTLKPGAEKFRVARAPDDTGLYATCMPPGIPQTFFVPYYFQIVQAPNHVVVAHEYLNLVRIIPTDGRAQAQDPDPTWMGHAVGRWEGDTLVVDSIGYNDKTEINGYRHTEALHVVERFRRVDNDTLQYEATIDDPNVFTGPWVTRRTFPFLPEYSRIDEFVCENNRDYRGLFGNK